MMAVRDLFVESYADFFFYDKIILQRQGKKPDMIQ